MPLPTPQGDEKESEFVSRCIGEIFGNGTLQGRKLDANSEADREQVTAVCYGQLEKAEKAGESMNIGQIAKSAIETALAIVNDSGEITKERAVKLLHALEADLAEVWQPGDGAPISEIIEAKMKTVDGKQYPASDFLVVEDSEKPTTWHLQVKRDGAPDHNLMGAAKAALTSPGGHRGNKYEGPMKAEATAKLKALYKSEKMEWVGEAHMGEHDAAEENVMIYGPTTFVDLMAAEQAQKEAAQVRMRSYQYQNLIHNIMNNPDIEDKPGAIKSLADEFANLITDPPDMEESESESIAESASEASALEDFTGDLAELGIDAVAETGRRAPVLVDFQILEPGPGNKRDNHYYPREMVARDAHVFNGVDVFATDHQEAERSERTKVARVRACPTRFTESGAPVAQVVIYDPDQAEKARNRADAGELATLECSIYARGLTKQQKIDGKDYKVVEAITEGKYLELVSSAGAGGHALNLSESNDIGGNEMEKTEQEVTEAQVEDIKENEPAAPVEQATEATQPVEEAAPERLAEADVEAALGETNLPKAFKAALSRGEYKDADALKSAISEAVADVKALTGSGQPFGHGNTQPAKESAEDKEKAAGESFNRIMREVGLEEV